MKGILALAAAVLCAACQVSFELKPKQDMSYVIGINISGTVSPDLNGFVPRASDANGKMRFSTSLDDPPGSGDKIVEWAAGSWGAKNHIDLGWYSSEDVATPDLVETWTPDFAATGDPVIELVIGVETPAPIAPEAAGNLAPSAPGLTAAASVGNLAPSAPGLAEAASAGNLAPGAPGLATAKGAGNLAPAAPWLAGAAGGGDLDPDAPEPGAPASAGNLAPGAPGLATAKGAGNLAPGAPSAITP